MKGVHASAQPPSRSALAKASFTRFWDLLIGHEYRKNLGADEAVIHDLVVDSTERPSLHYVKLRIGWWRTEYALRPYLLRDSKWRSRMVVRAIGADEVRSFGAQVRAVVSLPTESIPEVRMRISLGRAPQLIWAGLVAVGIALVPVGLAMAGGVWGGGRHGLWAGVLGAALLTLMFAAGMIVSHSKYRDRQFHYLVDWFEALGGQAEVVDRKRRRPGQDHGVGQGHGMTVP